MQLGNAIANAEKQETEFHQKVKWLRDLRVTKGAISECDDIHSFHVHVETLPERRDGDYKAVFHLYHDKYGAATRFIDARDWDAVSTSTEETGKREYRTCLEQEY